MNELDKKLIPEDIPEMTRGGERNIWRPFVKQFGSEPLQWLQKEIFEELNYPPKQNIPSPQSTRKNTRDRILHVKRTN